EPIVLSLTTQHPANKPGFIQAKAQGTLSVINLQNWLQVDLSKYLQGAATFTAELNLSESANQLLINTDLQGVKVSLPMNYSKGANEKRPLKLGVYFKEKDPLKITANYSQTDLQLTQGTKAWQASIKSHDFAGDISFPV